MLSSSSARLALRFDHAYAGFRLQIDVHVPMQGVTAFFGPSGSGKTTLLRLIAGLEKPARGFLQVGDTVWQDGTTCLPAHQRRVGYVFQDARLFPHLSVAENLAYGQRRSGSRGERESGSCADPERLLEMLGIAHLQARRPARLSGGEAQRVAIARALLTDPQILLMDEPLAALDAARKAEILPYLERLHAESRIPIVYVSHQFDEIARLADHVVLLDAGRVLASGSLAELTTRLDLPLAQAPDAESILDAHVQSHDSTFHLTTVAFAGGRLQLTRHDAAVGQAVRVRVRARDVSITLDQQTETSILNILPARIETLSDYGLAQVMLRLRVGDSVLLARITRKSAQQLDLQPGRCVFAQIKSVAIVE